MLGLTSTAVFLFCVVTKGCHGLCNLDNTTMRLDPGPDQGILMVVHNATWGTVCDAYFTNKAAAVVCRSFGQQALNAYRTHSSTVLPSKHGYDSLVTRVKCTSGKAASLCGCNVTYAHKVKKCSEASLIAVVCTNIPVRPTWFYQGRWLGPDVKLVNVTERDSISCAAINDTARFMTTKIYVPGETKNLRSGSGKQTVPNIQRELSGRLSCSISNWQYRDQSNSTIQLNVHVLPTDVSSKSRASISVLLSAAAIAKIFQHC